MNTEIALREIITTLLSMQSPTHEDVNRLKIKVAAKYHLEAVPANADLIAALTPAESKKLLPIIRRKNNNNKKGKAIL